MKYKAKQTREGTWAVFAGRKFFIDTATMNKEQAEHYAIIYSMRYHYQKAQDCFDELNKVTDKHKNDTMGDLLC